MKNYLVLLSFVVTQTVFAQEFATRKDSLQGGLRPERTSFDVQHYDLDITINPTNRSIFGSNTIIYQVIANTQVIQLDLFENMKVDSLHSDTGKVTLKREFNALFLTFSTPLIKGSQHQIKIYYSGKPLIARRAPWDGGFVFTQDSNGKDFIGVATQGTGASLWYPCKDSQSDEPDLGATIKVAVPNGLMNVSNGRFMGSINLKNGYTRWDWEVKNPINNYDITVNIADYVHFGENHKGLDLDYYVLRENEQKAKAQFEQVKPMMDCFQNKFGAYPFIEDGYKLVETPYLGMEHQSAVAYGNHYNNGYLGTDLSGTGIGLTFDYIIIHESGHEWFGNSITSTDIADMWIHEAFTMYAEAVYVECLYGAQKAKVYINGMQRSIANDKPIIGPYGVNKEGSGDMYYKGALFLNTLRHVVDNDDNWWAMLLKFSQNFRHQIIDTETVISFFNTESGRNLTPIFGQYLRHRNIPVFEMRIKNKRFEYRWQSDVPGFKMPIAIVFKEKKIILESTSQWQSLGSKITSLSQVHVATTDYFVKVQSL